MRKYLLILLLLFSIVPISNAFEGDHPHLSPAEFRAKQKEFIMRDAGLSEEEAAKFFPLYFELQDRRRAINDKSWQLVHQGNNENLTESQYKNILDGIYNSRILVDKLEKEYLARFRRVISYKKILRVHRAEMRFNRFLIRSMNPDRPR